MAQEIKGNVFKDKRLYRDPRIVSIVKHPFRHCFYIIDLSSQIFIWTGAL